jgi:PadR family transcriptional regulator PadR
VSTEPDVWASQLRKGVLELALLGLLTGTPKYGSQLVGELAAHPALSITAGTAYPLLARLAKNGLVRTTWKESPVGPPRKYYTLTDAGRAQLRAMAATFDTVAAAVAAILEER